MYQHRFILSENKQFVHVSAEKTCFQLGRNSIIFHFIIIILSFGNSIWPHALLHSENPMIFHDGSAGKPGADVCYSWIIGP